jgi:hypothetical protein
MAVRFGKGYFYFHVHIGVYQEYETVDVGTVTSTPAVTGETGGCAFGQGHFVPRIPE